MVTQRRMYDMSNLGFLRPWNMKISQKRRSKYLPITKLTLYFICWESKMKNLNEYRMKFFKIENVSTESFPNALNLKLKILIGSKTLTNKNA